MPKGGTVTFEVEPAAVAAAVQWIVQQDPFSRSIFIDALSPQDRLAREHEYLQRVNRTAAALIGWLQRRKRLQKPMERAALCIDRDLAKWMADFEAPRGLFGSTARAARSNRPVAVQYFFSRCASAISRPRGRPRITPDEASRRLREKLPSEIPSTSYARLIAREAEGLAHPGVLASLLAEAARRVPKTPD